MITASQILPLVTMVFSAAGLLLTVYALYKIQSLNRLKAAFFAGKNGLDLEGSLIAFAEGLKELDSTQALTVQKFEHMQAQLNTAIQKIGVVRFNPFSDGGGNFSFSLALLDAYNNGFVITSMHGREQNRMYTKRITNGTSESPLTEEENQAITLAHQYTHTH